MGLDTTHDAWSGPYTAFDRWRRWVAKQEGIPLDLMEGFYGWEWTGEEDLLSHHNTLWAIDGNGICYETLDAMKRFGDHIPWSSVRTNLTPLLHHSDHDWEIVWKICDQLADSLQDIVDRVEDDFKAPTYSEDHSEAGKKIWEKWDDDRARACYDGMVPATRRFIRGLRLAHQQKENLEFH